MAWMICPECEGEGTMVHPACSVWTQDDRAEDPDGFEAMMHGAYDIRCAHCGGSGKVKEDFQDEFDYTDARMRAMENGDWECANDRRMLRHYY